MPDREKVAFAVYLIAVEDDRVLMLRRANTGWQDGSYSLIAGHVDADESASHAMLREAWEEAGIIVELADLKLVHTMHRKDLTNYLDLYFAVDKWEGKPVVREPDKADDLSWFSFDNLPSNTVESVRQALKSFRKGIAYSEHGWD